jgi:endo-1,4-beta-mannosidase
MKRSLLFVALLTVVSAATAATNLGIEGTGFTLNGQPTFLLGISYYGALGAPNAVIVRDLAEMQKHGFNWIRVWATWAAFDNDVSAVTREGKAREPYLGRLRWLIEECDRRGMVVDVTLSRGNGVTGPSRLGKLECSRQAVETLVTSLQSCRNWYLDLGNERNIKDQRHVSFEELAELQKLAKHLDPKRLITASNAGDIASNDLRDYLLKVQVDFIAIHRPRNAKSAGQTADQTRKYFAMMNDVGRTVPVHYQEPFRRSFTAGWEPTAEDFMTDLKGARKGGAAGWCFHNGSERRKTDGRPRRSFDLRDGRLFDQLDGEEIKFLGLLDAAKGK